MNIDIELSKNKLFLIYVFSLSLIALYCFNYENLLNPVKELCVLLFLFVIGFVVINYSIDRNDKNIHLVAFVIIFLFGLMFVFLSPFNAATDEPEHFVRAEITSQDLVFPQYDEENHGFLTITSVATVPRNANVFETDWDDSKINHTMIYYDSAFEQNPFYGYIMPAIGINLAKMLDLNQIWLLWMGRLFNLLLYATICMIAIKSSPIMKMPMFVVACLPLSVELGASLNMDALTLSLSLLVIAYFFKLYKSSSISKKDIMKFFTLILILSLTKVTLGIFSLLILIIPRDKFENKNYLYLSIMGIAALFAILLFWNSHGISGLYHSWRGQRFIERGVDPQLQLSYILHDPQGIITLLSCWMHIPTVISELNRIYTFYPSFKLLSWIYAAFFMIVSIFYPIKEKFNKKTKLITLFVICGLFMSFYVVQFLTWAPVGTTNFDDFGISTRYFVPLFSLIPVVINVNYEDKFEIKYFDKYIITSVIIFLGGLIIYVVSIVY